MCVRASVIMCMCVRVWKRACLCVLVLACACVCECVRVLERDYVSRQHQWCLAFSFRSSHIIMQVEQM